MNASPSTPSTEEFRIGDRLFGVWNAETNRQQPGLLDVLRQAGFRIGPQEHVAVASLVAELLARRRDIVDLADLRPYLAPLLARSPAQRADFFRIFDSFAPTAKPVADDREAGTVVAPPSTRWWLRLRERGNLKRITIGALVLMSLIAAVIGADYYRRTSAAPTAKTSVKVDTTPAQPAEVPIAAPAPTQVQTTTVDASNPAGPALDRIIAAAKPYSGAPTLNELAKNLAQHSPIRWSAEAYAVRLQELTGLPRHQPLALAEAAPATVSDLKKTQIGDHIFYRLPNGRGADTLAQIGLALARMETPGREPAFSEFSAAATQRANSATGADTFVATALVEKLNDALLAGQLPERPEQIALHPDWSPDKALPVNVLYDHDTIARAMALAPYTAWAFAEEKCLAEAIYYEASGESDRGREAVAQVVLNRALKGVAANSHSICDVVYQRNKECQFTFTCDGTLTKATQTARWTQSKQLAARIMLGASAPSFSPDIRQFAKFIPSIVARDGQAAWTKIQTPSGVERVPAWVPWLALGLPLLLVVIWLANNLVLRKAYLRRRAPEFPPLHMDLVADTAVLLRSGAAMFQRISQRLQRRIAAPSDRIDIDATVRATIAEGGSFVVPRFAHSRAAAEYLVLIEKSGAGDQNYEYLRAMISRLKDLVALDIYTYQREPSILELETGGQAIPIERLMSSHPFHRLLVLGSGIHFLDPVLRKPLPGAAALTHWDRRALLTPVPLAEWAEEEYLLARELSLPIGRATPEGLMALTEMLRLEGLEDDDLLDSSGDNLAQPLPDVMRLRPQHYLYSQPPKDRPVEQIIQDLRNYLDRPGFEWLCALAVYPAVQWDLTLFLGVTLAERAGGDPKQSPLHGEERIAALTQLPWLREGRMPNWLRRGLIQSMSDGRSKEVRGALRKLIEAARSTGQAAKDETIRIRIGRESPRETLEPHELYDDEVLLDFMAKGEIEDFEFPNANFLARFLPEAWVRRFGWPELAAVFVAIAYAAAAYYLSPKQSDGALITNAWIPVLALGAGAAFVWAALNLNRIYIALKRALEWVGSYALAMSLLTGIFWMIVTLAIQDRSPLDDLYRRLAVLSPLAPVLVLLVLYPLSLISAEFLSHRAGLIRRTGRMSGILGFAARLIGFALVLELISVVSKPAHIESSVLFATLAVSGLAVSGLAIVSFRKAPERLQWNAGGLVTRLGWRAIVIYAAIALLPLGPAIFLMREIQAGHTALPRAQSTDADIVAMSPDGRFFARGGADGTVQLFASDNPDAPLRTIPVGASRVASLSLRYYGKPINAPVVAAVVSKHLYVFDGKTGSPMEDLAGVPQFAMGTLQQTSRPDLDDPLFAVSGETNDGLSSLRLNREEVKIPKGGPITALASAGPGQFLYGLLDGTIGLAVQTRSGVDLRPAPQVRDTYEATDVKLPFLPYAKLAISRVGMFAEPHSDGKIYLVDLNAPHKTAVLDLESSGGYPLAIHFDAGSVTVLTTAIDVPVTIWNMKSGCEAVRCASRQVLKTVPSLKGMIGAAKFSPDGSLVAIALSHDPNVQVWNRSGALAVVLEGHRAEVASMAFSVNGTEIVTSSRDGTARVWDVKTGKSLQTFVGAYEGAAGVAEFSPDQSRLLTVSDAGSAHVWDVHTAKKLFDLDSIACRVLSDRVCQINSASYSSDGLKIVTSSSAKVNSGYNDAVHVWNASTGHVVLSFAVRGGAEDALYSSDVSHILTFGSDSLSGSDFGRDGMLRIWDVASLERDYRPAVAVQSLTADDSTSPVHFTAVMTDGAVLKGDIKLGQITKLAFVGRDDRLALGPSVVWRAPLQKLSQIAPKSKTDSTAPKPGRLPPKNNSFLAVDPQMPPRVKNKSAGIVVDSPQQPPKTPVGGFIESTPPPKKAEARTYADLLPELRKKYPGISPKAQGPLPDGKGEPRYKTNWVFKGLVIPVYVDAVTGKVTAVDGSFVARLLGSNELPPIESQTQQTAPLPPERPPAPGLTPKTYIVYFDFDKYSLTPEAANVVSEAASYYRYAGYTKCTVTGHTDKVPGREYAIALSEREAAAVKAEMVRLGMDAAKIVTIGKGQEDPAVSSDSQPKQPLNRRAVITCDIGIDTTEVGGTR